MDRTEAESDILQQGRAAFGRGAWAEAAAALAAADAARSLDADDLDRLSTAAYLIGDDAGSVQTRTRAHAAFLDRGDSIGAARSALWLAFTILDRPGQRAQAAGWLARAHRLLDEVGQPCAERGWLLCASARQRVADADFAGALAAFGEASAIGAQFADRDLVALARHGEGRALLALNRVPEGLALLDEVMIAVTGGEVAPIVAGSVYCSVITACHDLFDLRRAQEWTAALEAWCTSQPDVVAFRGRCLIHRAELLQLQGAWQDAIGEARHACERLGVPAGQPDAGAAYYQLAELHRLRGEFQQADDAYRQANEAGRKPQPGLALLRLAQGHADAAAASIRLALQETRHPRARIVVLAAAVEILIAAGDLAAARSAADDMVQLAERFDLPFPRAASAHATGAVRLAEGDALAALEALRAACTAWRELDVPYELARVRALVGLAQRRLGDQEGGQLELEAAHEALERLGAAPAATAVAALIDEAATPAATGSTALTGREIEVLRLVATGATNRAIATRLGISEKTVARHISNIFIKLDLSSRAAATAYAYEKRLL